MKETSITDRLTYLAEQFDIFDSSDELILKKKLKDLKTDGYSNSLIDSQGTILAIVSTKINEKNRFLKKVSVSSSVFGSMVLADPTENKMYIQWMLNVFTRFVKTGTEVSIASASRFVNEDLPQANAYLMLFEDNKRKKKFYELCKISYSLKSVEDPTNINQYKSLSQLFDAVDPFIAKEPSALERTMDKYVATGQAIIPVKDRKFTLYIPKTTAASVIFASFASWCTAREGNGEFDRYTGNKKPNGKNSDIYIIINNDFFKNKSTELYQIHFESKQIKDKANGSAANIYDSVLSKSEGIANFFKEELLVMAKEYKKGIENNEYLDYLVKFGFPETLFELYDENTPSIRIMTREVPKLPDMSRFKDLDQLIICDAKLSEIHPSIGHLTKLGLLSVTGNCIKSLPKEIGMLKNLTCINIVGNIGIEVPTDISYLDRSHGGSLERLIVKEDEIGAKAYQRLKELLPTTVVC